MTRESALARAAEWFDQGGLLDELRPRVAQATASDSKAPLDTLEPYLRDLIVPALSSMGFACTLLPEPLRGVGPMLIAQRVEDPGLPTVLSYGHGDTVSGQATQWREGLAPWALSAEGDRWYGRGTADNKGQHSINIAALRQVLDARGGRLGFNFTLLLEMGEEVGSPGLREVCQQERMRLKADVFIASDGPRVHARKPTLFLGSRGIVNFSLRLKSRDRAYHSGNWGGVLTNPAVVVANAVASMVGPTGRLLVAGLQPPALGDEVRHALRNVEIGGDTDDPVVNEGWGQNELSVAERLMGWNTLEVLALGSGAPERPINAIPHSAVAHCQLRFVPGTPWQDLQSIVRSHLDAHGYADVEVEVTAATPATRLDMQSPWIGWVGDSVQRSVHKPVTVLPNLAGSLPNDAFAEILGLPTLWVPHSYPACAQHAPNEHLLASVAREGLLLMTGLFWDLGEPGSAPWGARCAGAEPAAPTAGSSSHSRSAP